MAQTIRLIAVVPKRETMERKYPNYFNQESPYNTDDEEQIELIEEIEQYKYVDNEEDPWGRSKGAQEAEKSGRIPFFRAKEKMAKMGVPEREAKRALYYVYHWEWHYTGAAKMRTRYYNATEAMKHLEQEFTKDEAVQQGKMPIAKAIKEVAKQTGSTKKESEEILESLGSKEWHSVGIRFVKFYDTKNTIRFINLNITPVDKAELFKYLKGEDVIYKVDYAEKQQKAKENNTSSDEYKLREFYKNCPKNEMGEAI